MKWYCDYVWIGGIPYGIQSINAAETAALAYKIPMDPYRKRISIEKYHFGQFQGIVYDSYLFDFRHLKAAEQLAWQKEIIETHEKSMVSIIRNQDDRLILQETYLFENDLCRECRVHSGHGLLLSMQKMFYASLGDPFNGVVLYDSHAHSVMCKRYAMDETNAQFTTLLREEWDMRREIGP